MEECCGAEVHPEQHHTAAALGLLQHTNNTAQFSTSLLDGKETLQNTAVATMALTGTHKCGRIRQAGSRNGDKALPPAKAQEGALFISDTDGC